MESKYGLTRTGTLAHRIADGSKLIAKWDGGQEGRFTAVCGKSYKAYWTYETTPPNTPCPDCAAKAGE